MTNINEDKKFLVALLSVKGIGQVILKKIISSLVKHKLSPNDFWNNKNHIWQKCEVSEKLIDSIKNHIVSNKIEDNFRYCVEHNIRVITIDEVDYPLDLKSCVEPPMLIFVQGNLEVLQKTKVGVIGTRKITAHGLMATHKIVDELAEYDVAIISGFMYGVDITAQKRALKNKICTVGILGFGMAHIYPSSQKRDYLEFLQNKNVCFISEYPPYTEPAKHQFIARNRLIAALSEHLIVIEAASKSGTHSTVEFALAMNKNIYATIGPINSIYSEGTKELVNEGATLISSGHDLELQKNSSKIPRQRDLETSITLNNCLTNFEKEVLSLLQQGFSTIDSLIKNTKMTIEVLHENLSRLELRGLIIKEGNNYITLCYHSQI